MSVYLPIVERAGRALVLQTVRESDDRSISREDLRSGMLRRLVEHWEMLRGDRSLPSRRELRPEEMDFAVGRMMLVDIFWPSAVTETADPTFRFRLVGAEIENAGHKGLTGRWAHELQPEFYRHAVLGAYREAATTGQPSIRRIRYAAEGAEMRYERVVLPLADQGTVPQALLVGTEWGAVNRDFFRLYPPLSS